MQNAGGPLSRIKVGGAVCAIAVLLAGCENTVASGDGASPALSPVVGATSVTRDVERPDIFSVSEKALWDGRPSLGGVWVAYPENLEPERVIIRNVSTGKSVIGALFRRERELPGPHIQLSSDAAVALGVIAGTPTEISIVVLRRAAVEVAPPAPTPAGAEAPALVADANMTRPARRAPVQAPPVQAPPAPVAAQKPQDTTSIASPIADTVAAASTAPAQEPAQKQSPLRQLFAIKKPYIQIGTFSNEQLAKDLLPTLEAKGVRAQVQGNNAENPTLWRVVSGPYSQRDVRKSQMKIIKSFGFTDAFFFK